MRLSSFFLSFLLVSSPVNSILYERLASPSSSADAHNLNQAPPPSQLSRSYSGSHQNRGARDRPVPMDSDPTPVDYHRQHGNPRPPPPDPTRSATQMEPPPLVHSPHASSIQSPRHNSAHDASRHLPPLSHLPPVGQVGQYDNAGRSHSLPQANSPTLHHTNTNPTSHERGRSLSSRSHPSSAQNYPAVPNQQYPDSLPPVQRVIHSPPPHPDRDRPPPRRIESNEYPPSHNEPHLHHSRHPSQVSPHLHPSETRISSRMHPHQHMGPGAYMNREESLPRQYDMERDKGRDRERDWDRDPRNAGRDMHSPHATHRRIAAPDYPDHAHHYTQGSTPRLRDEQVYYHEGNPYPSVHASRSDSSSGSGIGAGEGPSRPDSRAQVYEQQDRTSRPSYRLRPVNPPSNDDPEFPGHEDVRSSQSRDIPPHPHSSISATATPIGNNAISTGGSNANKSGGGGGTNYLSAPPPGPVSRESHPPPMSERGYSPSRIKRKRNRNDMEMDVDNEIEVGDMGKGREMSSRRDTPGQGYSGDAAGSGGSGMLPQNDDRDRDRDRASSKRYQREHIHHRNRETSTSPLPSAVASTPGGLQDQQQDTRMTTS